MMNIAVITSTYLGTARIQHIWKRDALIQSHGGEREKVYRKLVATVEHTLHTIPSVQCACKMLLFFFLQEIVWEGVTWNSTSTQKGAKEWRHPCSD